MTARLLHAEQIDLAARYFANEDGKQRGTGRKVSDELRESGGADLEDIIVLPDSLRALAHQLDEALSRNETMLAPRDRRDAPTR